MFSKIIKCLSRVQINIFQKVEKITKSFIKVNADLTYSSFLCLFQIATSCLTCCVRFQVEESPIASPMNTNFSRTEDPKDPVFTKDSSEGFPGGCLLVAKTETLEGLRLEAAKDHQGPGGPCSGHTQEWLIDMPPGTTECPRCSRRGDLPKQSERVGKSTLCAPLVRAGLLPDLGVVPEGRAQPRSMVSGRDQDQNSSEDSDKIVVDAFPPSSTPIRSKKRSLEFSSLEVWDSIPSVGNALPSGKFMTIEQIINIVKSGLAARPSIPVGKKDNVFFLLNDSATLCDDCGIWDSKKGSTVNSYFVIDEVGKPKTIYFKNQQWCTENRCGGKKSWVPLPSQPLKNSIIKVHRYYASLKDDQHFKKRVTTVISKKFPLRKVVEYCGVRSKSESVHGNAKMHKVYIRTDPRVMEKISDAVKTKPPRQVYQEMVLDDSFDAPRNLRQIRDKKYNDEKKERQQHRNNVADEAMSVIEMLNDNPTVQKVIMRKNKAPCVILYSDEQMEDLKKSVAAESVFGVDRTFNLGACFVTTTVYKNVSVNHRVSGKNPLFLGPMYLHWDENFETYHGFFSHLQVKLHDLNVTDIEIKIGSDQEYAIIKALRSCFPKASHILCSRHLRDDLSRFLADKEGCSTEERNKIIKLIFGGSGVVQSEDKQTFENRCLKLLPILNNYPQFKSYFNKLKPLLFSNVCEPNQRGKFVKLWTNNNCELLNNIFKLSLDWKNMELPDLVEKLSGVAKLQMLDLR